MKIFNSFYLFSLQSKSFLFFNWSIIQYLLSIRTSTKEERLGSPQWEHNWCVLCFRLRSITKKKMRGQLFLKCQTDTTQARMSSAGTATSMDIFPRTALRLKSVLTYIHIQLISQDKRVKLMCVLSFSVNRGWRPASFVAPRATSPFSAPISTATTAACLAIFMIRVPREPIGTKCVIAAAWPDTSLT